uniref:hypothetical protein n=1 Tax=Wolbachia endosymbiont (group A) of Icerya purchasi TaxID=2954019 RepID=UPI00222FB31E|nr:hypothetical protein [Wolbachia endosymbiont (group A) of Icerya purchasi]
MTKKVYSKTSEKKVFLELLNRDLLETDFSLKDSSLDEAEEIADKIIEKEVKEFELKTEKTIENQINGKIDILLALRQEKIEVYYRVLRESGYHDLNAARKEQIDSVLNSKLQITAEEAPKELLKLRVKRVYESSKGNVTQLYEKIIETKKEFIEDGLLTPQEVENITKAKIIDLNERDKIIPSSNLSRSLSVNNLAAHYL